QAAAVFSWNLEIALTLPLESARLCRMLFGRRTLEQALLTAANRPDPADTTSGKWLRLLWASSPQAPASQVATQCRTSVDIFPGGGSAQHAPEHSFSCQSDQSRATIGLVGYRNLFEGFH